MSKPDWAERLQRTRRREYERGWDACLAYIIELLKTDENNNYYALRLIEKEVE